VRKRSRSTARTNGRLSRSKTATVKPGMRRSSSYATRRFGISSPSVTAVFRRRRAFDKAPRERGEALASGKARLLLSGGFRAWASVMSRFENKNKFIHISD
jgi:hypothetical protein